MRFRAVQFYVGSMSPDPLDLLDDVIRALEAEKQLALPVLANAKGVEAERVFKAIKELENKLLEVVAKRAELVKRRERASRIKEITQRMRTIREELAREDLDASRREKLRREGTDLQAEAKLLVEARS